MSRRLQSIDDAIRLGALRGVARADIEPIVKRHAFALTQHLADLIDPTDPGDPIALQFLPSTKEAKNSHQDRFDPLGDRLHSPVSGIVHRYPDRLLLMPVRACPAYCRFCFRREQVGPGSKALSHAELALALDYIRRQEQVWEVILSGGDPLMLKPKVLGQIIDALNQMTHIGLIRVHSRVPVADPSRISDALTAILSTGQKTLWLSIHVNHPRELSQSAEEAIARLLDAGIPLVSQTVLLHGVNDSPEVLERLFRRLTQLRVKPYYLHHPDPAPGTGHFRVGLKRGRDIASDLRSRLSGLCLPAYMIEIPGGAGKVPAEHTHLTEWHGENWPILDAAGDGHSHPVPND